MKFLLLLNILLINIFYFKCLIFRRNSHDLIIKFSNDFYKKLESENKLEEYKNHKIIQIQNKINKVKDNLKNFENNFIHNSSQDDIINFKNNKTSNFNNSLMKIPKRNSEKKSLINSKKTITTLENLINNPELTIKERSIQFHISLSNECNVLVNDTISYELLSKNIESVEHLILNNNFELIDPKGVFADNAKVSMFVYNKKLNMFTVYFDENAENKQNFTVEFDYLATNLIKAQKSDNSTLNNNSLIWKFYNENFQKINQKLNIEFYFSIDKMFEHENLNFFHNSMPIKFNKNIIEKNNKNIVKYEWKGELIPNEIIVMDVKFPLYLENCGNVNIDVSMIIVGSLFIVFLILILYITLSQILKIDDY